MQDEDEDEDETGLWMDEGLLICRHQVIVIPYSSDFRRSTLKVTL